MPSWATPQIYEAISKTNRGEELKSLIEYGADFSSIMQDLDRRGQKIGVPTFATLAGANANKPKGQRSRPPKPQHPCPCQEDGKTHFWKPSECATARKSKIAMSPITSGIL